MMTDKPITSARLEAFSDGVFAIIITIMVLELKVPHADTIEALLAQWPVFLSYGLSFLVVAEYWMNHHMLFNLIRRADNRILWSNLLLLFMVSLIPFFTACMGENRISSFSTAVYSAYSMMSATSFLVLLTAIFPQCEDDERIRRLRHAAIVKNLVAIAIFAVAVPAALVSPALSLALNFVVAGMYFLPNSWMEKKER